MSPSSSYVFQAPRAKHNLCLKWEHLCSNFRPTVTKESISALVKRNKKRTIGVDLSMLWTSDSVQAVKDTWAKPSLLIPITRYDTLKIFQNDSCRTTASPMCRNWNVLFVEPFQDFQVSGKLLSSRSVNSLQWGIHKHLPVKVHLVRAALGRLHPLTSPLLLWKQSLVDYVLHNSRPLSPARALFSGYHSVIRWKNHCVMSAAKGRDQ